MPVYSHISRGVKPEAVMPLVQTLPHELLSVAKQEENSSARVERTITQSNCQSVRAKPWPVWQSENYSSITCARMDMQQESGSQTDAPSGNQSQNKTTLQGDHTRYQSQRSIAKFGRTELYRFWGQSALVFGYYVSVDAPRLVVSCHCVGCIFAQDCRLRFQRTVNCRPGRRGTAPGVAQSNCDGPKGVYNRIGISLGPRQSIRQRLCANDSRTLPPASKHEQHRMLLRQCDQRNVLSHTKNGIDLLGAL